jgi:eukaryotic-like serine/threonine-protein kinase
VRSQPEPESSTSGVARAADLPVREGQVFAGKFRVERFIGDGAMGLVVEATHLGLDERVALKFLRREALSQPEIVARFAREARASVKIKSDHVAKVFDVGAAEDGTPFIVMELLSGSDLCALLEVQKRLDVPEAADYMIQACEGIAEAHARGIIHRDIKPGNLFLARGAGALKQIKVLDFGISKAALGVGPLDVDLTSLHTTQIMGSPHYMSPEQLRSTRDVDARADIWSLGVVLFELLTGDMPFTATEVTSLIAQILHEPHQRLTALRPDVPAALESVIDRCLAKDPALRFQSAADVAVALLPFAPKRARASVERAVDIARSAGGGATLRDADSIPPPPGGGESAARLVSVPAAARREERSATHGTAIGTAMPVPPPASSRGWLAWVVALVVGVLAASLTVLATRGRGGPTTGTEPAASSLSSGALAPSTQAAPVAVIPPVESTTPAPVEAPSAVPAEPVATARNSAVAPVRPFRPTSSPPTAKPAGGAPRPAESEIRMER